MTFRSAQIKKKKIVDNAMNLIRDAMAFPPLASSIDATDGRGGGGCGYERPIVIKQIVCLFD